MEHSPELRQRTVTACSWECHGPSTAGKCCVFRRRRVHLLCSIWKIRNNSAVSCMLSLTLVYFFPTQPTCNCTVRLSGPPRSWQRCWIHGSSCKLFCPIANGIASLFLLYQQGFHFLVSRTNCWPNCVLKKRAKPLWPHVFFGPAGT